MRITNKSVENKPLLYKFIYWNWNIQETVKNTEFPVNYEIIQFEWWFGHRID